MWVVQVCERFTQGFTFAVDKLIFITWSLWLSVCLFMVAYHIPPANYTFLLWVFMLNLTITPVNKKKIEKDNCQWHQPNTAKETKQEVLMHLVIAKRPLSFILHNEPCFFVFKMFQVHTTRKVTFFLSMLVVCSSGEKMHDCMRCMRKWKNCLGFHFFMKKQKMSPNKNQS